jgi:hypothetical protein
MAGARVSPILAVTCSGTGRCRPGIAAHRIWADHDRQCRHGECDLGRISEPVDQIAAT